MRNSFASLVLAALGLVGGSCSPAPERSVGSESHFLGLCDGSCDEGLVCVCGVCTESCDPAGGCPTFGATARCVSSTEHRAASSCQEPAPTNLCDAPCASTSDCSALGPQFFCRSGFCRVDTLRRPGEPVAGFGALCEEKAVACLVGQMPPELVGNYMGQGSVVLSSNALWAVGNSEDLTAQITQEANGIISGTIQLQSFLLEESGSVVRGEAAAFSIYTSGFAVIGGCNAQARAVVSGVLDQSVSPATVKGGLALRFTGNFGEGCTEEQMTSYPATGADFLHSESRLP